MKKLATTLVLLGLSASAFASTHKFNYDMPCTSLWPAVKDTLRNSGKYGIIGIDSTEMTASYNMGGNLMAKRINSLVLNTIATGCELQVQTAYSGLFTNDVGDLKKRVDDSIVKLKIAPPPASPATPAAPAASAPPAATAPPIPH
ncbi:MAG TPA: hypothetical protein VGU46_13475 [Acidobacteriaceae bacterium]|nr:hypothetical protein [Acidobacteriaceae bacterium]